MKTDRPAIVRPAECVATLIAQARAADRDFETYGRKTQDAARRRGEALLKAKAACGQGEWLDALKAHWPGLLPRTAQRYMKDAQDALEGTKPGGPTSDNPSGKNDKLSFFPDGLSEVGPAGSPPADAPADPPPAGPAAPDDPPQPHESNGVAADDGGEIPASMAHVGWLPPSHYADLAGKGVNLLVRFRTYISAILEGPCGDAAREYFRKFPPRWHATGESVHEHTTHGVRVMGRVHECDELGKLVAQAGALETWLRRPEALADYPADPGDAA